MRERNDFRQCCEAITRRLLAFCAGASLRSVVPIFVCLIFLCTHPAAARTWYSRDGRTLEGDIVKVRRGKVSIKRDSGGELAEVPLVKLSDEDLDYIDDWLDKQKEKKKWENEEKKHDGGDDEDDEEDEEAVSTPYTVDAVDTIFHYVPFAGFIFRAGWWIALIWGVVIFLLHAAFIHLAAQLMRFRGHLSDCVKAAALEAVIAAIIVGATVMLVGLIGSIGILLLLTIFLAGPIAILVIYDREFLLSVLAYLLAMVLTAVANAFIFFGLVSSGLVGT